MTQRKPMWNDEAVKAYESGQGVVLVENPYPHYVPLDDTSVKQIAKGNEHMSEPTAWINKERDVITFDNLFPEMTPLYEKREWVGLTEGEIEKMRHLIDWTAHWSYGAFAKAIEQALKEKNNG